MFYISTNDRIDRDSMDSGCTYRVTVARVFDSWPRAYWIEQSRTKDGERIHSLSPVAYTTREPRPGDKLRVVRTVTGFVILPPHVNDDADGNPIPVRSTSDVITRA